MKSPLAVLVLLLGLGYIGLGLALVPTAVLGLGAWALATVMVAVTWSRSSTLLGMLRTFCCPPSMHEMTTKHTQVQDSLRMLESARDLHATVYDASLQLLGCVGEGEAREQFALTLRRYWSFTGIDIFLWERGAWRTLGGSDHGPVPLLQRPVHLPNPQEPDLVLDLSPGVDGQAAVVLRQAQPQPSLDQRSLSEQSYVADMLRSQLALALRRVVLYADLEELGRTDALTGLMRRWYALQRLGEHFEQAEPVSVIMIDIDHFKSVNDRFGHAAGDAVLRAISQTVRASLRTADIPARYGGEEFCLVLPHTDIDGAQRLAERLRTQIAALDDCVCPVTASLGVAQRGGADTRPSDVIARADAALYRAKHGGRDRVIVATQTDNHPRNRH